MQTTSVFERNLLAYQGGAPIICNQGGTRSSKTYSVLQLIAIVALYSPKPLIISIVSYALPHLKLGAMRSFEAILADLGVSVPSVKNITESQYRIGASLVEFFGVDNAAKVHGPERDILFVNEANFVKGEIFDQLRIRTRGTIFVDFNPSREFWFHEDDFQGLNPLVIKSTYLDNEHLSKNQVAAIESKRNNARWWRVYGEGELGQLEGAVFEGWRFGEFDYTLPSVFGQDYGFSADPTTLIRVAIDRKLKRMYWDEAHYSTGLLKSTSEIAKLDRELSGGRLIVGDSAERRLIYELRKDYSVNIVECLPESKKSIASRIARMLDYEHIVTERSANIAKELNYYTYIDKGSQLFIDDFNHAIDAAGYGFDYLLFSQRKTKPRTHVPK